MVSRPGLRLQVADTSLSTARSRKRGVSYLQTQPLSLSSRMLGARTGQVKRKVARGTKVARTPRRWGMQAHDLVSGLAPCCLQTTPRST